MPSLFKLWERKITMGEDLRSLFKLGVKTRFSGVCLKQGKDKLFLPIYTDCAVFYNYIVYARY